MRGSCSILWSVTCVCGSAAQGSSWGFAPGRHTPTCPEMYRKNIVVNLCLKCSSEEGLWSRVKGLDFVDVVMHTTIMPVPHSPWGIAYYCTGLCAAVNKANLGQILAREPFDPFLASKMRKRGS